MKRTRSLQSRMPCRHFPCKAKTCNLFGECGPTLVLEQSPEGLACSQCPAWRVAQRVRCTWKGTGMLFSNTNSSLQNHGISVLPTYRPHQLYLTPSYRYRPWLLPWHCDTSLCLWTRNKTSSTGNRGVQQFL